ncbi:hypothetical protein GW17_00050687, partial [Ensete ventricosum]
DGASKGGRGSNEGTSVAEGAATTLGSSGGRGGDEDAIARMVAAAGLCWREKKQQRWIRRLAAGQRLAVAAARWPRAREGGGSGVSVSSAQRWLQLRKREAAVEVALEEKGRWWPTVGAGEEEGEAAMAVAGSGGEEKGDGRGYSQEGTVDEGGEESGGRRG